jgi:hypothetical protein
MRQGWTRLGRAPAFRALTGLGFAALLASTATAAAADREYKGWYVALDSALTQPNSLDQHFANEVTSPTDVERLVLDNKAHATFRGTVGYTFGSGMGSLQASYWGFDHEDREGGTTNDVLDPTLFGYGYAFGGLYLTTYPPFTFEATGKVKATTIDFDYVRPIAVNEKFSLKWLSGLRVAHYEEDLTFAEADSAYPANTLAQAKHFESDAKGLRLGVTGVFGFTKHFSLEASFSSSFLQANTKGDASQTLPVSGSETEHASDDHIRGEIRDYDLRAVWSRYVGGHLDLYLGYSASNWDGLVTDPLPGNENFPPPGTIASRGRQTISFDGLHGGIVWRFGRIRSPAFP